jgi:GNAT superfamily N-acetyltransferase
MPIERVRRVEIAESDRLAGVLARAFESDPMAAHLFRDPARRLSDVERMHPTKEPHWYLAFLGVEPSEQGRGVGSALLRPVLDRAAAEGAPAWLETATSGISPSTRDTASGSSRNATSPGGPTSGACGASPGHSGQRPGDHS